MSELNTYIEQNKDEYKKSLEFLKGEMNTLRTGRAQSTLVENIQVDAYGTMSPLMQLANISVPDAQSISIEVWDKSILKEAEKALSNSKLGLSVVNVGDKLIAKISPMTEENRKELIKILGQKVEAAKVSIRQVRDKIKENVLKAEKEKEITEDDRYKFLTDLDNFTSDYNKKIEEMSSEKEKEIMTI